MVTDLIKSKLHELNQKAAQEIRTIKADVKTFKHEIYDKIQSKPLDDKEDTADQSCKQIKAEIYDYVSGRLTKFNNGFSSRFSGFASQIEALEERVRI